MEYLIRMFLVAVAAVSLPVISNMVLQLRAVLDTQYAFRSLLMQHSFNVQTGHKMYIKYKYYVSYVAVSPRTIANYEMKRTD